MSICVSFGSYCVIADLTRTKSQPFAAGSIAIQALPTDPVGVFELTLIHLIDGSALQIESQDGTTTLHNSVVSGTSKTVNVSVYSAGSPLNNLRIKVRKGSASPFYQPYETEATAIVGSQPIYVSQVSDE